MHKITLLNILAHFMTSVSKMKIILKPQKYNNPWTTKRIKSEKMYEKILKTKPKKWEVI